MDVPGRDSRRDFLTEGEVFETDNVEDSNVDVILDGQAYASGGLWRMAGPPPPNNEFVHVRVRDENAGQLELVAIVRDDGKRLLPANAWLSKARQQSQWKYYVNVFDTDNPGGLDYTLHYGGAIITNRPPVWVPIPDQIVNTGQALTLNVAATDPNGTIPLLSTGALPAGVQFQVLGNGQGRLTWTPLADQEGRFAVTFRASDAQATTAKTINITVTDGSQIEGWKDRYWPGVTDPNVVGNGADPDRDGLDNLLEYAMNLDPTKPDFPPMEPGSVMVGNKTYLTLTYLQRTGDPDLETRVLAADSPSATWNVQTPFAPEDVDQTGVPAGMVRISARDTVAMEDADHRRVMRVEVKLLP